MVEVMRCAGEAVRDVDHGNVGRPDIGLVAVMVALLLLLLA